MHFYQEICKFHQYYWEVHHNEIILPADKQFTLIFSVKIFVSKPRKLSFSSGVPRDRTTCLYSLLCSGTDTNTINIKVSRPNHREI